MASRRSNPTQPGPDPLSWSDAWLSRGDPDRANSPIGRVNTPAHVARWMVQEGLRSVRGDAVGLSDKPCLTIVEPAAGSGVILAALAEALGRTQHEGEVCTARSLAGVWAIDSDPHASEMAGRRLTACMEESPTDWLRARYRVGDALIRPELLPETPVDLVIGNPPYLGLRHARRLEAFPAWRARFGGPEDLYVYFIRWAVEVVRPGGCVALLVPDGWLSLPGCEGLRAELLQGSFELISLLPRNTFAQQVNPCFFVWRKIKSAEPCRYVDLRDKVLSEDTFLADLAQVRAQEVQQATFEAAPHRRLILPLADASRFAAICSRVNDSSSRVTSLAGVAHIADAGIHSRNCRHKLFFAERVKPHLHKLLQGRQIDRYTVRWDSPNAQFRWVDIHYEPNPNTPGRRRDGSPSVRNEYWDWQGSPELHERPERILIRQTGDSVVAARCEQAGDVHYTDNTLFTAILKDAARKRGVTYLYLLAYLNSHIVTRLYQYMSCERGRPQAQIKIGLLRELPFVWPKDDDRQRIEMAARTMETGASSPVKAVRRTARWATTGAAENPSEESADRAQRVIDAHFDALLSNAAQDTLLS